MTEEKPVTLEDMEIGKYYNWHSNIGEDLYIEVNPNIYSSQHRQDRYFFYKNSEGIPVLSKIE